MQEPQQTTDVPAEPADNNFMATLLRAAWLAILLGIVMETLLLLFAAGFGIFPGVETIAADLVRQLSWSTFVCVGLAIGTAVSKARVPLMGIIGLLAAPSPSASPAAFIRGRSRHSRSPAPAPTPHPCWSSPFSRRSSTGASAQPSVGSGGVLGEDWEPL
jgi:hypothetical protein